MKRPAHYGMVGLIFLVVAFAMACETREGNQRLAKSDIEFYDAREQAAEFISYYHSISLKPEGEEIKKEALSAIPAPCCKDYSIATCCCPCNLAKSVWGLSHLLIAREECSAVEVREVVERWIAFTNESGYSGVACYTKGCNRPFEADGCGGMSESRIL